MKTIPNDKNLSGSIVLERGTGFLSKQIIMHMAILAKMMKVKPLKYSHSETLVWDDQNNQLWTIGAREKGTECSMVQAYYGKHEVLILEPVRPLTAEENKKLWAYFNEVDKSKYQFGNFLAWIGYLKTKLWLGRKGDVRVYCYELAGRFANEIGRWPKGKSLDRVSIYDLCKNPNYKPMEE